jgi:hypothetical protein
LTEGVEMMHKKLFISHKISEHGKAVEVLKSILQKFTGPTNLEIVTSIPAGEDISEQIKDHLKTSDLFLLLANYSTPPKKNEWCIYEMGVFDQIRSTPEGRNKKLISLVKEGSEPPDPIKHRRYLEETREGIRELLKEIYKGLRDDLFVGNEYEEDLENTITDILGTIRPPTVVTELAPRVWLTIKKDKFNDFKDGKISLPMDTTITGETELFLKQKVCFLDNQELTLDKFKEIVDYPVALPPFLNLLDDILREILRAPRHGPWQIPPLRTMKNTSPRIIVPSVLQKDFDGNYIFEFFVTEPPPYTGSETDNKLAALYNLFVISWRFRWIVIERHLKELIRKYDPKDVNFGKNEIKTKQIRKQLKKLVLDMDAINLDSFNRNIEYRMDVTANFENKEQYKEKDLIEKCIDIWKAIKPKFDDAVKEENIPEVIRCLIAWRDINKTVLIFTLKQLSEVAGNMNGLDGRLIDCESTAENILEQAFA